MNLTQMHERLRIEMLRRIQRGTLSISLLSRQTGLGKSHLSNFLHARRHLSLTGIDRMLSAQHMSAADLLALGTGANLANVDGGTVSVPVVSHATALFEPLIRPSAVLDTLTLPPGAMRGAKAKPVHSRRLWQRFVAIRVARQDSAPMDPLLLPDAVAVIDRHYNSLSAHTLGRPNLFAVRDGAHLKLRYADFVAMRLVLRPISITATIDLIEIGPDTSPGDLIAGRVALIINQL
jgi:hypothetical protein